MKVLLLVEYVPLDKDKILSVHVTEMGAKVSAGVAKSQGKDVDVSEWETYR